MLLQCCRCCLLGIRQVHLHLLCRAVEEAAAARDLETRVRAELAEGRAAADAAADRASAAQEEARSALARAEERGRALDARADELVHHFLKSVLLIAPHHARHAPADVVPCMQGMMLWVAILAALCRKPACYPKHVRCTARPLRCSSPEITLAGMQAQERAQLDAAHADAEAQAALAARMRAEAEELQQKVLLFPTSSVPALCTAMSMACAWKQLATHFLSHMLTPCMSAGALDPFACNERREMWLYRA